MAATGISVTDEVAAKFNDIKLGKVKAQFVVYKIEGPNIVEEHVSMDGSFDDFVALMPEDDCRYALYDFKFQTNDGRDTTKLAMISWAPDTAKVKSKMIYAGSKDALSRVFVGVATKITATDMSELTEEICLDACKKFA